MPIFAKGKINQGKGQRATTGVGMWVLFQRWYWNVFSGEKTVWKKPKQREGHSLQIPG